MTDIRLQFIWNAFLMRILTASIKVSTAVTEGIISNEEQEKLISK